MKRYISFGILATLLLSNASCRKDRDTVLLDDSDVSQTIEASLKISNGGITADMEKTAQIAYAINPICSYEKDSSITSTGANYTAALSWSWGVSCTNAIPTAFNFTATGNSSINTTKTQYSGSSVFDYVLTAIAPSQTAFVLNGTATRNGSTVISGINNTKSFTSNQAITFVNIAIQKTDYKILSGTASFTLNGTVTNGSTYSKTGTIVFNGNGAATITINGNTYNIVL